MCDESGVFKNALSFLKDSAGLCRVAVIEQ